MLAAGPIIIIIIKSGEVLDLVEVFAVRIVLVLANPPLLQAAPEHHRPADLLSRGLKRALDGLPVALLLQRERGVVMRSVRRGFQISVPSRNSQP